MDSIPEPSKIVVNTVGIIIEPVHTIIENVIDIVITPIPKIIDTVVKPLPNAIKKVNKLIRRNSGTFSQNDLTKNNNEKRNQRSKSEPPQRNKDIF